MAKDPEEPNRKNSGRSCLNDSMPDPGVSLEMDEMFEEDAEAWGDETDSSNEPMSMIQPVHPSSIFQFESVVKSEPFENEETVCPYCHTEFQSEELLEEHMEDCPNINNESYDNSMEEGPGSNDNSDSNNLELNSILSFHPTGSNTILTKQFGCTICPKKFRFKSQLNRHIKTHTGDKPHACTVCGGTFASRWHLTRHQMTHLVEQKVFFCELCLTAFSRKKYYEVHLRIHSKQKPFKCGECPACFKIKDELILHMQVHSGRKPVNPGGSESIIVNCNSTPPLPKLVPLPVSLKVPNLEHVSITVPSSNKMMLPKLTPSSVGISATSQGKGKRGRKKNPTKKLAHACEICGHAFSRNHHLQRHKLIHTGERPFSCGQCDKSFSRKERLNAHIQKDHFTSQPNEPQPSEGVLEHSVFGDEIVGF